MTQKHRRLVRNAERRRMTAVPDSTCYVLMAQDKYPKPIKTGPRSVAWIEDELLAWIEARIAEAGDRKPGEVSPRNGGRQKHTKKLAAQAAASSDDDDDEAA